MDIAVLGATGTMGRLLADRLEGEGHAVRRLSRGSGTDAFEVGSLTAALAGADVVVDATNHMALRGSRAVRLFSVTSANVVRAAERAGVSRAVCIGIAGASDPDVGHGYGYYRGKAAQEGVYRRADLPATIVLSTQWFELIPMILRQTGIGPAALLPRMAMAPVAAERVADLIARDLTGQDAREGTGGDRELVIRGPETMTALEAVRRWVTVRGEIDGMHPHLIAELPYFGGSIATGALIPDGGTVDDLTLEEWLRRD